MVKISPKRAWEKNLKKVMKNGSTAERGPAEEKPMYSCPAQSSAVLTWSFLLSHGKKMDNLFQNHEKIKMTKVLGF